MENKGLYLTCLSWIALRFERNFQRIFGHIKSLAKALKHIEGRFEPLKALEIPRHPEENDRWRSDANPASIF